MTPTRWAAVRGWRRTATRFKEDWSRLPKSARDAWLLSLTAGWAAAALLMLGMARLGERLLPPLAEAETALLLHIVARSPFPFDYAIWLESPGNALVLITVTLVAALAAVHLGRPLRALSLLAAFFMLAVVVVLGWAMWSRARPDMIAEGIASPSFHSFPSGHVTLATAVYGLLFYFWLGASRSPLERALALFLFLLLVMTTGLARLVLGTHWPSDFLAGFVLGSSWLAVLIIALRRAERTAPTA